MTTTRRSFFGMLAGAVAALRPRPKSDRPNDEGAFAQEWPPPTEYVEGEGVTSELVYLGEDFKEIHRGPDGPIEDVPGARYVQAQWAATGRAAGGIISFKGIAT